MMNVYYFVYGALRPGVKKKYSKLQGLPTLGIGAMTGKLYNLGGIPVAVQSKKGEVVGEVFKLPKDAFSQVAAVNDILKNEAVEFKGKRVEVAVEVNDEVVKAVTYVAIAEQVKGASLVLSGDWEDVVREMKPQKNKFNLGEPAQLLYMDEGQSAFTTTPWTSGITGIQPADPIEDDDDPYPEPEPVPDWLDDDDDDDEVTDALTW